MALGSVSDIPQAFQRALALQNAGRGAEALAIYSDILMLRPATAEALFQAGRIHAAAGARDKAVAAFRKAVALKPGEQAIWAALAQVVPDLDRGAELATLSRSAAPAMQGQIGAALWSMGRPALAEPALQAAVKDGVSDAVRPLAELLVRTCRPEEAEKLLAPRIGQDAELALILVRVRAALRKPEPARQAARRAISNGAPGLRTLSELASLLDREGETKAALTVLAEVAKRAPDTAGVYVQRAQLRQSAGDLEGAETDLRRAIDLDPLNGEAFRALTAARKLDADDPVAAALDAALASPDLSDPARQRAHFAKAKLLADLGRDDEVFDHLDAANALQRAAAPYDFEAALHAARDMFARFESQLAQATAEGSEDRVIFVTGLPRSGTTLVETIFAAHRDVQPGGELTFMADALAPVLDHLTTGPVPAGALAEAGQHYLRAGRRRAKTKGIFTDKAIGTFTRVGHILLALPGARIFALDRDPRDVGLSIYRNMFPDGLHRFATDLRDIGRYIRLEQAMIDRWNALLPGSVTRVSYESLTEAPEAEIPPLIEAAGLDWDPACLAPHEADRRVDTLSFAQVRQPIYRSSVAAWTRFDTELTPLVEGLETEIAL